MFIKHIPYKETGCFSKIIIDYLNQSKKIKNFYNNFPNLIGFKNQIKEKKKSFNFEKRSTLVNVLKDQYENIKQSELTLKNINSLSKEETLTITTGHQLNLFTGPLYFLYKIISTINLCERLTKEFPKENFVPIYWMASEDHDFDEINFFNFNGEKIQWNSHQIGGVGRFTTNGLEDICKIFSDKLNQSKNANELREIFNKAYTKNKNLAQATRYIVNKLFGEYGLVIIDADNKKFKQSFIPFFKEELLNNTSYNSVSKTIKDLSKNYKIQVNPREINLFYLTNKYRERIIYQNNIFKVKNTKISWSKNELIKHLENYPEKFSPNVIIRPIYQEVILPNICYIGGGGELAYWLELKKSFENFNVTFPILLLRNSVQIISNNQLKRLDKIGINIKDIFLKQEKIIKKIIKKKSKIKIDFSKQKLFLNTQFIELRKIAEQTNKSFIGAVNAQEKKQIKGLNNLEKKWLRAEKINQLNLVNRIVFLYESLFPNKTLEERHKNFSELYLQYNKYFIKFLKENLNPLKSEFTIVNIDEDNINC